MTDCPDSLDPSAVPTQAVVFVVVLAAVVAWFALGLTTDDVVAFARSDAAFPTTLGLFVFALALSDWWRRR